VLANLPDVVYVLNHFHEQQRLSAALELNQPLALAYYMKEDLRQLWIQPDKVTAALVLREWLDRACGSGARRVRKPG
jgi:transposase